MTQEQENPDFEILKGTQLNEDILNIVKRARIEARDIINRLDPNHIYSWVELIEKLELALGKAKRMQTLIHSKIGSSS